MYSLFLVAEYVNVQAWQKECSDEAKARVAQQLTDAQNGELRASYSYGALSKINARTPEERYKDAFIGALAESFGAVLTKAIWRKPRQQYLDRDKENPDLKVVFKGEKLNCHVQGKGDEDFIIFRNRNYSPTDLFLVINNLLNGPYVFAGHAYCGYIRKLCEENSQWQRAKNSNSPYFAVPLRCFFGNFSLFGK